MQHSKPLVSSLFLKMAAASASAFPNQEIELARVMSCLDGMFFVRPRNAWRQSYARPPLFCLFLHVISGCFSLDDYIEKKLMTGYSSFTREEALAALPLKPDAFTAPLTRQISKKRLANPRHGFYIILRPEDKIAGAPDPARWIDPLMNYLSLDYLISLLRAAAMHGSSHQAAMVFQVVVPRQFRSIVIGRHRIQFIYLAPAIFNATNQKEWLASLKTDAATSKPRASS